MCRLEMIERERYTHFHTEQLLNMEQRLTKDSSDGIQPYWRQA